MRNGPNKTDHVSMCAEQHIRRFRLADKNAMRVIRTQCSIYKLIYWTLHVNDCINTSSKKTGLFHDDMGFFIGLYGLLVPNAGNAMSTDDNDVDRAL